MPPMDDVIKTLAIDGRHPGRPPPAVEAVPLKESDAGVIVGERERQQKVDPELGAGIDGMLEQSAGDAATAEGTRNAVADLAAASESAGTAAVGRQSYVAGQPVPPIR